MLLAKNEDWETCSMIYFQKDKISQLLNIPEDEVPFKWGRCTIDTHNGPIQ